MRLIQRVTCAAWYGVVFCATYLHIGHPSHIHIQDQQVRAVVVELHHSQSLDADGLVAQFAVVEDQFADDAGFVSRESFVDCL